jgi:hypothetical protein
VSLTVGDPERIDEAAQEVVGEPLGMMKAAHEYLEKDCVLHPLAFGVLFSALVSADYEAARKLHSGNLAGGETLLQDMGNGLAAVAANLRKADHASNPTGRALSEDEAYHPVKATDDNWDNKLGIAPMLMQVQLAAMALVTMELETEIAEACWTAIIAAVVWMLVIPDDAALSKAIGGWEQAGEHLGKIDIPKALTSLNDPASWGGPSRDAFNTWLGRLHEGIESAKDGAEANVKILESLFEALNHIEEEALKESIIALVKILVLKALEEVPYIGEVALVMEWIEGIMHVIAVLELIELMHKCIEAAHHNMINTVGPTGTFAGLRVDSSGKMITLTDVRVDWDDADVNDIAARADHGR